MSRIRSMMGTSPIEVDERHVWIVRGTYRDLRKAGVPAFDARVHVTCLLKVGALSNWGQR